MSSVTHLVQYEGSFVRPVCGDFSTGVGWATLRYAVTCPECLKRSSRAAEQSEAARDRGARASDGSGRDPSPFSLVTE